MTLSHTKNPSRGSELDIKEVKRVVFDDLEKLLDNFEIEYELIDENYHCACPIHEGSDNSKAVSISKDKKSWRCWTRGCHEQYGTDIFGFVRGVLSHRHGEEANFSEALGFVCSTYNIGSGLYRKTRLTTTTPNPEQDFCDLVRTFNVDVGLQRRLETPGQLVIRENVGLEPSPYFIGRGFSRDCLSHFGVYDETSRHAPFFLRSIIPVHSLEGGIVVGAVARATREYIQPKFLFSKGFKKSNYLYNYHRAIEAAQELGCLFVCEGQGDVWRLWECGVYNAVSIFGKEILPEQKSLLIKSGITTIVVVTDNDQAGRESKIKIQRDLSRYFTVRFPRFKTKDIGAMSIDRVKRDILPQVRGLY